MWKFIKESTLTLLQPLKIFPLQIGRIDFSPLLAGTLVLALARWLPPLLHRLYLNLPL